MNLKLGPLFAIFIIFTISCGEDNLENLNIETQNKQDELSEQESFLTEGEKELSADAEYRFEEIKEFQEKIRSDINSLCSIENDPDESIKNEISLIIEDSNLTVDSKNNAIKDIHIKYAPQIEAYKNEIRACETNHSSELSTIRQKSKNMTTTCGITKGPKGLKGKKKGHKRGLNLAPSKIDESKILSEECKASLIDA